LHQNIRLLPTLFRILVVFFIGAICCIGLQAQSPITTINVSSTAAPDSQYNQTAPTDAGNGINDNGTTEYTVRNGTGNDIEVTSYVVGANTYNNFLTPDTLAIKRTDGSRFVNIWYTLNQINTGTTPNQLDLDPRVVTDADLIYQTRNVNAGYDNILVNVDDLASDAIQAQIERVDIIWYTGIVTCEPDNAVFPVVERGGNDNIKVAAILSLDANGEPASYSPLILIASSDWPGTGQSFDNYLILRRQTIGQDPLPLLNIGTIAGQGAQIVQGVAVSFTEFGIAANQVVYGYSIFASDTNDTDHDLIDITTFPTTTASSVSGIDLVAGVTAAVSSDNCLSLATGPGGYKAALATWLKANVGVTTATDGNTVTDWQDQWTGDHDATSGEGEVIYRSTSSSINFNPTADFGTTNLASTTNNSLTIADNSDFNTPGPFTRKGINLAFRTSTSDINTRQVLYEQGGNTRGINIYLRDGNLHLTAWNKANDGAGSPWNDAGTNVTTISTSVTTNTEYIVTLEEDGNTSSTGTVTGYLNGQSFGTISGIGLLYNHTGGIEIGGSDGNTRYDDSSDGGANSYFGEISELIYCNEPGAFPLAQRSRIESYLGIKYGITLNQSTPINYVNAAGDIIFNATSSASIGGYLEYNNDIAGIGRDDNSVFEQQKSKSENNESVVTIDKGGSFGTDNSWLIWGNDDGLETDSETTDVPPLIAQRVEKVWRVAETGETGNNSISFDISELSISGTPTASDYSLLVAGNASDGDFSSATILTGGVLIGSTLTFSNVNLSNGHYFTIGTAFINCAPGDVSANITLWLKADFGTSTSTNGANVSTWTDQAGGNDASAASGNEPSYLIDGINFNPALDFDDTNTEEISGTAGFNSAAYYAVINTDLAYNSALANETVLEFEIPAAATDQFGSLILGAATGAFADEIITHAIGGSGTRWRRGTSQTAFGTIATEQTLMFGIKNNGAANSTELFVNGIDQADLADGALLTSANVAYRLGGTLDANSFADDNFNGQISEIISYSARPTDAEHERVQSYLAIKYGITLSQNTAQDYVNSSSARTVIWNGTTNASYNADIAGIGRDDNSCLEQKQSKSGNSGSIVTIGNNGIFSDNGTNPNSFTIDKSFLVWGNDAVSATFANRQQGGSADVPAASSVTERMSRVWRVQESGTVSNTSVAFDLTGLGYDLSTGNQFQLMVSPNATIANATTIVGGTLVGNVITFNSVDFNNGDFFTLGTARDLCGPGGVTADLALWLKGGEGTGSTTNNTDVNTWADQSTNGRNANEVNLGGAVPVEPQYLTNQFNFNPAIQLQDPNSTNASFMRTTNGNNVSGDMSLIAVLSTGQSAGSTTNFEDAPAILSAGSGDNLDYGIGMTAGRLHINAANNNTLNARSPEGTLYNNQIPLMVTGTRIQATSAGSIQLYVNSENVASGVSTDNALGTPTTFGIGNHSIPNAPSQLNGIIAETIVFSDDLTDNERQRVDTYLAVKYGITRNAGGTGSEDYLASDSGIIWNWDEVSGDYSNDIAGIGRDDNSCFVQPKSKSNNAGSLVTIEVDGILNTDDSFMLWGNNNVAVEATGAEGNTDYDPSQVSSRLFREWYVQEKADAVGNVLLTYDLATVTGPSGLGTNNLNQVRLMVDADGVFASGASLITPTSIDAINKTVTFTVNLNDTQYFTLGSTESKALPITLISFQANRNDNEVVVNWATADETNNAFFTIERSSNGFNFETIGTVAGAGNSDVLNNYSFINTRPLAGNNFFRLKQTDVSGEFTYSEIVRVFIEFFIATGEFSVYPNPIQTGESLNIKYSVSEESRLGIKLVSTSGQVLLNQNETVYPESGELSIPTNKLQRGLTLVIITNLATNQKNIFKIIVR
jgi:hypothetical protein